MKELLFNHALAAYEEKEAEVTPEIMRDGRVAVHHAADHRPALGGSLVRDGRAQERHRPARLRAERPARRVRKRSVRDLRGPQEQHRRRSDQSGVRGARRRRRRPTSSRASRRTAAARRAAARQRTGARQRRGVQRCAGVRADPDRPDRAAAARSRASIRRWRNACLGPAPKYEAHAFHTNRGDDGEPAKPKAAPADKVGRNELCPCGSGKKYKRCHGA